MAVITEHSGNSFVCNYALVPELGLQNKQTNKQTKKTVEDLSVPALAIR